MTNAEIIATIRSEIERLYDGEAPKHDQQCDFDDGYFTGIGAIAQFLDSLESEKPVPANLEEYASRAGFDYVDNIVQEHPDHRFNDHDVEFAYRDGFIAGAKLQKEQDEKEQAD